MPTTIVKNLHHRGLQVAPDYALASDVDAFWLMFGAILVFFMQTGFAMLEVGSVQQKNTKNILIKNIFDAAIGAICFWLFGWGIAFGKDENEAAGSTQYALVDLTDYALWLFQWAFSATAATIVSGAVAERISFTAYFCYAIVLCSLIYPFIAHWAWSGGFMSAYRSNEKDELLLGCGVLDFAGSGVVHMTGGICALVAVYFLGARTGRFHKESGLPIPVNTPDYSPIFQCLGTLILFMGWFGFNGASTLAITGLSQVAARSMATTAISASAGCLACVVLGAVSEGYLDYGLANNGVLAGLVGITASASTVEIYGAFVIGVISAMIYWVGHHALLKWQIDDVVDASPVHFFCGMWGVLAAGFFTTKEYYAQAYSGKYDNGDSRAEHCAGVFYGGSGNQLGANILFILLLIAWVGGLACILFVVLKYTVGLRTSLVHERRGLDDAHHMPLEQRNFEKEIDKFEGVDGSSGGLELSEHPHSGHKSSSHGGRSGHGHSRSRGDSPKLSAAALDANSGQYATVGKGEDQL